MDSFTPDALPEIIRGIGPGYQNALQDIVTCSGWKEWIEPYMDIHAVGLYATGKDTQHVWRFMRKEGGINPGNVEVSYKKYAAPLVTEVHPVTEGEGPAFVGAPEHRFRVNTYGCATFLPGPADEKIQLLTSLPPASPQRAADSAWDGAAEVGEIVRNVGNRGRFPQFDGAALAVWQDFLKKVSRWQRGQYLSHELRPTLLEDLRHQVAGRQAGENRLHARVDCFTTIPFPEQKKLGTNKIPPV